MKKLDNQTVKWFEQEQKQFGTKVALHNLLWTVAADLFKAIGIKQIKTKAESPA